MPSWEAHDVELHFSEVSETEFHFRLEEVLRLLVEKELSTDGQAPIEEKTA